MFCNQPRPEVNCSELIDKNKSKVLSCGSIANRGGVLEDVLGVEDVLEDTF